jgi:ribosomal protein S18 acetylase RimI-like enzyme
MIRAAGPQDVRFLRDMLRHAYYWRMNESADLPVARYVLNWGRPGDEGLVALDDANPVGAAWYRLFPREEAGFGFVDESTPELTIAVVPSRRGKGFGHELMTGLLEKARRAGYDALSLSVAKDSPAVSLYERYGFRAVAEPDDALTMVAKLGSPDGL